MASHIGVTRLGGLLRRTHSRAAWVSLYTTCIITVGGLVVASAMLMLPGQWAGLLFLALMGVVAEALSVELFVTSRGSRVSMSSAIAIAGILLFGPMAGVFTHALAGLATAITSTLRRQAAKKEQTASFWRRLAFNTAMFVIAAQAAGWVYVLAGGTVGNQRGLADILPLALAACTDTALNLLILLGVLTLQTGRSPIDLWQQDFRWAMPIYVAADALGGAIIALAYGALGILGAAAFCLPVLSAGYSFRIYAANMRGYVAKLEEANRNLDEANLDLLEALGAIIDAYDAYTYGHSRQVAVYAGALAEKLGLPEQEQARVVRAALIHDLGKVGVMDSIIGKQGPLTAEEFAMVKRHPQIGAEIVGQIKGLQDLVPLVGNHHERWDGRGYPEGRRGEELPLGARILALADTLDAMCSDRPYRPTCSLAEARAEIERGAGTQFDPQVVRAFLAIADEKGAAFFQNSAAAVDKAIRLTSTTPGSAAARYLKKGMVA